MTDFKSDRREFIRFSSVLPLVALAGCVTPSSTESVPPSVDCDNVQEHTPYPDTDSAFRAAKEALWQDFQNGIRAMHPETPAPEVPDATKDHIFAEQGRKLARKMKFWSPCEQQTRLCSYSAGVIAELLRQAEATPGITVAQFEKAKIAVKAIQAKRSGRNVVGIAC